MKPRTLAILAVVFTVTWVGAFVGNWIVGKQVRADLDRIEATYNWKDEATRLDPSAQARFHADLDANRAMNNRARVLLWIGMGSLILAIWSNTLRARVKMKLAQSATDQGGSASGDQRPVATT